MRVWRLSLPADFTPSSSTKTARCVRDYGTLDDAHLISRFTKVWSCGCNDNGALGRVTVEIPDPNDPTGLLEVDEKTREPAWTPVPMHSLVEEGFRAVKIVACNEFSAAISDTGELRAWGTFSVCISVLFSVNSRLTRH